MDRHHASTPGHVRIRRSSPEKHASVRLGEAQRFFFRFPRGFFIHLNIPNSVQITNILCRLPKPTSSLSDMFQTLGIFRKHERYVMSANKLQWFSLQHAHDLPRAPLPGAASSSHLANHGRLSHLVGGSPATSHLLMSLGFPRTLVPQITEIFMTVPFRFRCCFFSGTDRVVICCCFLVRLFFPCESRSHCSCSCQCWTEANVVRCATKIADCHL